MQTQIDFQDHSNAVTELIQQIELELIWVSVCAENNFSVELEISLEKVISLWKIVLFFKSLGVFKEKEFFLFKMFVGSSLKKVNDCKTGKRIN